MNKLRLVLAALALSTIATSTAIAGMHINWGFTVDPVGRYAIGVFSHVRDSPDPYSRAECGSNSDLGTCLFADSANNYYSCYTIDPLHNNTILSMSSESYFVVQWNASGECTMVRSYTMAATNPKAH
jgi:hypothetical protein